MATPNRGPPSFIHSAGFDALDYYSAPSPFVTPSASTRRRIQLRESSESVDSMFTSPAGSSRWYQEGDALLRSEMLAPVRFEGSSDSSNATPPANIVSSVAVSPTNDDALPVAPHQASALPHRRSGRPRAEKLNVIFDSLSEMNWTVADFLYNLFRLNDERGRPAARDRRHGTIVGTFLSGGMKHTASEIVSFWLHDTAGKPKRTDSEFSYKFSPTVEWQSIRHASVALTAMACQLCETQLIREQRRAVKGSTGLHGSLRGNRGRHELAWSDIGCETVAKAREIFEKHQPLTLHILTKLATPRERRDENGLVMVRKARPPALVATELLSSLNFSHTMFARLLPAARSILFFASGVPRAIFDYHSRVGNTQSWSTTYSTLARLAKQDAEELVRIGRDEALWGVLRGDNVQEFEKVYDPRIGRESKMKVGLAATYAEVFDFIPAAADLDDRLRRIEENKRAELTVSQLVDMVDFDHIEAAFELQWVQVLTNYIPCLAKYKPDVAKLYETDGAKLRVPPRKTRIHSLATMAKNEAVTTELRDAVVDLLQQIGQHEEDYTRRLVPVGGDGLTFEKIVQLKNLLRFQDSEFRRLDIVLPFLETWHTQWTFLCLIYETHFGTALSNDPATLGHSASKINQKEPPNLKKVDYYPYLYLLFIVLDARMLDCWRIELGCTNGLFEHFESLSAQNQIPSLNRLRAWAKTLHRKYSTERGGQAAKEGGTPASRMGFRTGPKWTAPNVDPTPVTIGRPPVDSQQSAQPCLATTAQGTSPSNPSSLPLRSPNVDCADSEGHTVPGEAAPQLETDRQSSHDSDSASSRSSLDGEPLRDSPQSPPDSESTTSNTEPSVFVGDNTLASSILFMRDAMLMRDSSQAVASGDVGRLWNNLKMMMFIFAGSGHTKYMGYLLEMMCSLELESSPELREVFLKNWLVNPSGEPGRTIEGDIFQEHINFILEDVIGRKNADWDGKFLREVIAPNAQHFTELKNEWGAGVGLAPRHGRHPEPHSRPEIRILLEVYRMEALHEFRTKRSYPSTGDISSTLQQGIINLEGGKLAKFHHKIIGPRPNYPMIMKMTKANKWRIGTGQTPTKNLRQGRVRPEGWCV
ncbi:hypothetical protein C8Q76DRAFT_796499 [Earliella scabrosa]|nr:hypothetical protein C8Q76DRAFT_796499 [Earliella scabrosa]